jgi:ABC-type multidrug transport system fused ATPase/permease subunit
MKEGALTAQQSRLLSRAHNPPKHRLTSPPPPPSAVERVREYSEVQSEAPPLIDSNRPPHGWPTRGAIAIEGLSMAYRPGLPLVLRDFTLAIRAGEKVGIVGR